MKLKKIQKIDRKKDACLDFWSMMNLMLDLISNRYTLYELSKRHSVSTRQMRRRIYALSLTSYFSVRVRPLAPSLQEDKKGTQIWYGVMHQVMQKRIIKRLGNLGIFEKNEVEHLVSIASTLQPLIEATKKL